MKNKIYLTIIIIIAIAVLGFFTFYGGNNELQEPTVNPGKNECNWEKLNQDVGTWFQQEERSGGFLAPREVKYSEVEFTGFGILAKIPTSEAKFYLNEVECGTLRVQEGEETSVLYELDSCVEHLNEGINTFRTTTARFSDEDGVKGTASFDTRSIKEIQVEMLIRPANCLS